MKTIQYEALSTEELTSLIRNKQTFEVVGLSGRMGSAVSIVENKIETAGLRCRIYTVGRIAAAGGSFFGGITGLVGVASAISIAAHNLATLNPDYEIAKYPIDNSITVKYKK
ncbi:MULTISPECIES: hypothetical protein [unclassified Pseudomonas]|uniref:hypothetical protein n=1 Tax=unclassified Pseudomonas TaxID=196821 RepID=UPI0024495D1A|nr:MULTISPECIES: hypothetical protein [unclassified Pseudomonas]MDH0897568.1 hypothetical protein [Pseudomonas sp. GD03875]MDH1067596.1 hypothetical protein [Pseudomonas sp. GD03985]